MTHPFEVLAEPIRRRIFEILCSGEHTAGDLEAIICHEFGVGRSAVQHHLRILLAEDWTLVREDWPNRWHRLQESAVPRLEQEVRHFRHRWDRRIGWIGGADPLPRFRSSKKGRRGRGADPDDPWQHPGQ